MSYSKNGDFQSFSDFSFQNILTESLPGRALEFLLYEAPLWTVLYIEQATQYL